MSTTEETEAPPGPEPAAAETPAEPAEPAVASYLSVTAAPGQLRAVIPDEWRRANIRATVRQHGGKQWHRAKFHGVRAPLYGTRTVAYAFRGAAVLLARIIAWWHCTGLWQLESQAVAAGRAGHQHAMQAHTQGIKTRAARGRIVAVGAVALAAVLTAGAIWAPGWAWAPVIAVVTVVLARYGRPEGKTIAKAAIVPDRYEMPTPEVIIRALGSLGIPGIDKAIRDGRGITFLADVHRDGPGWATVLDLPHGVTATEVIEKREKLASGLRSPFSSTWPSPSGEHTGRLHLWIGFESFADAPPIPWPLAKGAPFDLWKPVPFGHDYRGQPVSITLMFTAMLIAAMPRMGKTYALRLIALAAALDVNTRLRVWELKGTGDLKATRHVAHEYGSGADDETIEQCLASVRSLYKELDRRAAVIKGLPDTAAPESKVTPQLTARRDLGLFPEVMIIDEAQEAFSHKEYGAEFEWLTVRIAKRGPALGIMLELATQRPDRDSMPKTISANMGIRFCLKVMGSFENNAVLGPGMYAKGIRATDFDLDDKGIGYLAGHASSPQIVRTCSVNAVQAGVIALRARALREAAGTLSGYALGQDDENQVRDVLADVLSVFADDSGLHWTVLAERLARAYPDRWADATADAVSAQCRDLGVPPVQVKMAGQNLRGCRRLDVEQAAGAHV